MLAYEEKYLLSCFYIYLLKIGLIEFNHFFQKKQEDINQWLSIINQHKNILEEILNEKNYNIDYLYIIGQYYFYGILFDKNIDKALFYLKISAENDCPFSLNALAYIEFNTNKSKAMTLLKKAYSLGNLDSYWKMGISHISDPFGNTNIQKFQEIMKDLSAKEFHLANYELGLFYNTQSLNKNEEIKSFHYFLLAAENGHLTSMEKIAECYANGIGVKKDINLSILWLTKLGDHENQIKKLLKQENDECNKTQLYLEEKIVLLENTIMKLQNSLYEVNQNYLDLYAIVKSKSK